jgi:hypothetical protein
VIPYLGCEAARDLLEAFVDGELAMTDQVAVESHLRWCRTCTARVEDMRLISASMRVGALRPSGVAEETRALASMQAQVLTRFRAEREQSLRMRVRVMFEDMRFFWPALGASVALVACLCTAVSVLHAASGESDSMAGLMESTAKASRIRTGWVLEGVPEEEAVFTLAEMVTRRGRIADYKLLVLERAAVRRRDGSALTADIAGLLDAVRQSRFAPAEEPGGRAVAVDMVWLTSSAPVSDGLAAAVQGARRGRL